MGPEQLVFLIPIVAIIGGVASSMLKNYLRHKEKMMNFMSEDQVAELDQMSRRADILDQRVAVLESILDDEIPSWRENHDKTI